MPLPNYSLLPAVLVLDCHPDFLPHLNTMDNRDERQQLDELRALLKRVEKIPNKTGLQRREALKRLIEVVHSPYTSLKSLAASNFRFFIKDFPDLEDDAINAVYDLCEDSVAKVKCRWVRFDGYHAIISVSKEQKQWVKRNADVLVQLLQSDEPEEVKVVQKALIEHIDMDPVVTLSVLCDQVIPTEEELDEEDQVIRDRLRSLVLTFLTGDARRGIVERHAVPGSLAEDVLVSGMFKAIPNLPHADVELTVKDLLLSLKSFSEHSNRGEQLLEIVLETAKSSLKAELASGITRTSISNTTYFLELASHLAVENHVAQPKQLARFYCSSAISKMTLVRLSDDAKAFVLSQVSHALLACEKTYTSDELNSVRKQVVDACSVLLPCFLDIKSPDMRPWRSCSALVQTCKRRKDELGWTVPSSLVEVLAKIQNIAETDLQQTSSSEKASIQEAQSLIRSPTIFLLHFEQPLLPPPSAASKVLSPQASSSKTVTTRNGKSNGAPVTIQRNREGIARSAIGLSKPNSLPAKPPPPLDQETSGNASTRDEHRRQSSGPLNTSSAPSSSIQDRATRGGSRSDSGGAGAPTLLSRLGASQGRPTADSPLSRSSTPSVPAKRRAESDRAPPRPVPAAAAHDDDVDPAQGLRILGAASRGSGNVAATPPPKSASSLLSRLAGDGDSEERKGKRSRTKF
ncbi:hypothetical protein EIP91_008534 [Steccherinum ochraceum]|uniref:Apoptosis inhibitor 5 n=1 Tax=Steccherinum ochraceum TaxID=92696 RepID=A0A4R0R2Q9_9APHY|nr:hypothetical protein EIP91_008534 [Steccherinum ochraceum]